MADADDTKKKEDSKAKESNKKADKSDEKTSGDGIVPWIIMAVVVVICAGAGLGLGRLLAGQAAETAESSQQNQSDETEDLKADDDSTTDSQNWYYDLEPVVANLDVPGVTRYVRVAITLDVSSEINQKKGNAFFEEKKPLLTNWLTIYLASLGIEDIRGDKNLKRIQSQILDAFNERLFPDAKPQIKHILFKEFAIQ